MKFFVPELAFSESSVARTTWEERLKAYDTHLIRVLRELPQARAFDEWLRSRDIHDEVIYDIAFTASRQIVSVEFEVEKLVFCGVTRFVATHGNKEALLFGDPPATSWLYEELDFGLGATFCLRVLCDGNGEFEVEAASFRIE